MVQVVLYGEKMIIKQTQQAIKFYELAIINAQKMVEFYVNQDVQYIEYQNKYRKAGIYILYYDHTQSFGIYSAGDYKKRFFSVDDGKIVYENAAETLDNVKEMAEELLSIVGKFYE